MPIRYRVDPGARLVRAWVEGDFTMADVVDCIAGAAADPGFVPGFDILSDHTQIGEPLTPDQAREMVQLIGTMQESFAGARWAVVATQPASYGMARMFSVLAREIPVYVEVFPTLEEALAFLER